MTQLSYSVVLCIILQQFEFWHNRIIKRTVTCTENRYNLLFAVQSASKRGVGFRSMRLVGERLWLDRNLSRRRHSTVVTDSKLINSEMKCCCHEDDGWWRWAEKSVVVVFVAAGECTQLLFCSTNSVGLALLAAINHYKWPILDNLF